MILHERVIECIMYFISLDCMFLHLFIIHACLYACSYTCLLACLCMCTCGSQRTTLESVLVFLSVLISWFLSLCCVLLVDSFQAFWPSHFPQLLLSPQEWWSYRRSPLTVSGLLCGFQESEPRLSGFWGKCFYILSHLPTIMHSLF